jgi:hypothetical protein
MPWTIKNVSLDPAYAMLRRKAAKMDMEPVIASKRVRLRQQITISDELYSVNADRIALHKKNGVLVAIPSGPSLRVLLTPSIGPEEDLLSEEISVEESLTDVVSEEEVEPEAGEELEIEAAGAGWYVLRLGGEEIDKVRGKGALQAWLDSNGYPIPEWLEDSK